MVRKRLVVNARKEKEQVSKRRYLVLGAAVLVFCGLGFLVWDVARNLEVERELEAVFKTQARDGWNLTPEGTNAVRVIGGRAVPIVLKWSAGPNRGWARHLERKLIKWGWAGGDPVSVRHAKARMIASILGKEALPAVPTLVRRLDNRDALVRRFAVQLLGAIGPASGMTMFRQMTNRLTDVDKNVRNDVVWTLWFHQIEGYETEQLIPVFIAGLKDNYRIARENGEIGLKKLQEKDERSREAVLKAMREAGIKSVDVK